MAVPLHVSDPWLIRMFAAATVIENVQLPDRVALALLVAIMVAICRRGVRTFGLCRGIRHRGHLGGRASQPPGGVDGRPVAGSQPVMLGLADLIWATIVFDIIDVFLGTGGANRNGLIGRTAPSHAGPPIGARKVAVGPGPNRW